MMSCMPSFPLSRLRSWTVISFFAKEERENLLKLLIYNVGMNRTLEITEEWKER